MLVRPNPAAAFLFWDETPHCEVSVPQPDSAALEAEFRRMLASLSAAAANSGGAAEFTLASPEPVTRTAEADAARGEGGRLIAFGMLGPRTPVPGAAVKVFSPRVPRPRANDGFAAMVHRSVAAQASAAAPAAAAPTDTKVLRVR